MLPVRPQVNTTTGDLASAASNTSCMHDPVSCPGLPCIYTEIPRPAMAPEGPISALRLAKDSGIVQRDRTEVLSFQGAQGAAL